MAEWFAQNWIEFFGFVSTVVYLILSIRQSIWLWPLGALSSAIYIIVYFSNKFYADMGLQVYYLAISVYGFAAWALHKSAHGIELPIVKTNTKQWLIILLSCAALWALLYWLLSSLTDSPIPYGDSFTTALAIVATFMLTRKMIEQWLIFIIADATSVVLYATRGMQLTALLYIIYTIFAIVGYLEWRQKLLNRQTVQ